MVSDMLLFLLLLVSHFPCGMLMTKCSLNVQKEEKLKFHYYKSGDFLISGIISTSGAVFKPYVFFTPPNHRFQRKLLIGDDWKCRQVISDIEIQNARTERRKFSSMEEQL
ncbi:hypothetical protein L345_17462, partial [Ophiophagus hannah]